MRTGRISMWLVISTLFTACGMETIPAQATLANPTAAKTKTTALTYTPTSTNTWVPSSTPTIGPPPDLELKDVTIYPETNFEVRQRYYLMGKVRNNSNSIMQFKGKYVAFKFNFEVWEYDKLDKEGPSIYDYYHIKFTYEFWPGHDSNYRSMNCFLFPGEEGVVFFEFNYI
jgi:hypothetical protein